MNQQVHCYAIGSSLLVVVLSILYNNISTGEVFKTLNDIGSFHVFRLESYNSYGHDGLIG